MTAAGVKTGRERGRVQTKNVSCPAYAIPAVANGTLHERRRDEIS